MIGDAFIPFESKDKSLGTGERIDVEDMLGLYSLPRYSLYQSTRFKGTSTAEVAADLPLTYTVMVRMDTKCMSHP